MTDRSRSGGSGAKKRPLATVPPIGSWPPPQTPAISAATGYVVVPRVAVAPSKTKRYLAIFDATRGADKPTDLIPAVDMAGFMLNAFRVAGVPRSNPNVTVLEELRKEGVELFVCGQNLAFAQVDPKTLTPSVRVASDASPIFNLPPPGSAR